MERQIRDIKHALATLEEKWSQREKQKKLVRKRRLAAILVGRIAALAAGYLGLAVFFLALGERDPWIRALSPVIVVSMFLLLTTPVQAFWLKHFSRAKNEKEENDPL